MWSGLPAKNDDAVSLTRYCTGFGDGCWLANLALATVNPSFPSRLLTPTNHASSTAGLAFNHALAAALGFWFWFNTASINWFSMARL
ncbi:hypothetical protein D3C71_1972250 [compost metagenome]